MEGNFGHITTKIALVGPGAIGTTLAALLHQAGHPVLLCGRTARDALELRPDESAPIQVPGPVHTDPTGITDTVDVVILATKATQNAAAADWLARLCDAHTTVVVVQNGVEQLEQIQPHAGSAAVVPALAWFSSEVQPAGWVRLRNEPVLVLPAGPAAETVAGLLRGAGCRVQCDPDFVTAAWRKLMVNALAGFMVLTGRRSGMFHRDDIAELARRYVAECLSVARAEGAHFDDGVVDEMVENFRVIPSDVGTSILTDRVQDRPLEWDLRNGVIIRKARAHGLATPISDVLVPLLAAASDGPG